MLTGETLGIVGDLHFGKNRGEEWYKSYRDLFKWIKTSFRGKTKDIMFLGDVFDGKKEKSNEKAITFRMMEFVSDLFDDLAKEFNVIIYAGNHCCYFKNSCEVSGLAMLKGRQNINIIEEPTDFEVGGKYYRVVPWGFGINENNNGKVYDGIFAHIDIQTFKMDNGFESDHGYSTKELFKVCNNIWTGHYHTRQDRSYQKGKKRVFYAGSPLQLSWSESGKESYIHLLDLSANDILEEFENDFSPKFRKIRASKILDKPKDVAHDILTVIWDIENNEENQIKMSDVLSTNHVETFKNDYSNLANTNDVNSAEIKDVNDSVDVEGIIDLHTEVIDGSKTLQDDINKKSKEFYERVI